MRQWLAYAVAKVCPRKLLRLIAVPTWGKAATAINSKVPAVTVEPDVCSLRQNVLAVGIIIFWRRINAVSFRDCLMPRPSNTANIRPDQEVLQFRP